MVPIFHSTVRRLGFRRGRLRLGAREPAAGRRRLRALTAANATLLAGAAQSEAVALQLEAEAASLLQARDALRIEPRGVISSSSFRPLSSQTPESPRAL